VHAKQKLIGLLEEQKRAIIHRAVTRGLDPNVRLKPSGLEWLGEVPEHWDVTRLGRLIDLTTGFPFKSEGFTQGNDDIRLLRGINISPGQVRWDDVVRCESCESCESRVNQGTVYLFLLCWLTARLFKCKIAPNNLYSFPINSDLLISGKKL